MKIFQIEKISVCVGKERNAKPEMLRKRKCDAKNSPDLENDWKQFCHSRVMYALNKVLTEH